MKDFKTFVLYSFDFKQAGRDIIFEMVGIDAIFDHMIEGFLLFI